MECWTDRAFILDAAPLNEKDVILHVLTEHHGRCAGVLKFGASKKYQGVCQKGNLVYLEHTTRVPTQMGRLRVEMETPYFGLLSYQRLEYLMLQSATALAHIFMYPHDPVPTLFERMFAVFQSCNTDEVVAQKLSVYAMYEQALLEVSGFQLDLSACAATGSTERLIYISPKTGCAVSDIAGRPYHHKLLPLPRLFLEASHDPGVAECLDALHVNAYFIQKRLCEEDGRNIPEIRTRLEQKIMQMIPKK